MRVYFLRHGIAADRESWQGNDFDRPLTDEGRKRLDREAKRLAQFDLGLQAIVSSPLLRAKATAEIVAERLGMSGNLATDERLGPDFDVKRFTQIVREHADANAILLVGHEPNMSETIGDIVGGAKIDLKKGGFACVDISSGATAGELLWLIPPKVLLL
jgi:phosphohistidine phosphatase